MEEQPISDSDIGGVALEEAETHEEAIADMEKTFADFYAQDPESFEEAYRRVKRNTEMQQ